MDKTNRFELQSILNHGDDREFIEAQLEFVFTRFCRGVPFYLITMTGIEAKAVSDEASEFLPRKISGLTKEVIDNQSLIESMSAFNDKISRMHDLTSADLQGIYFESRGLLRQFHLLQREQDMASKAVCTVEYGCFPFRLAGSGYRQIWHKTGTTWELRWKPNLAFPFLMYYICYCLRSFM